MKVLCAHAKNLRIEAGAGGSKPYKQRQNLERLQKAFGNALPRLDSMNTITSSENSILALVCVEDGDTDLDLSEVKKHVLQSRRMLGVPEIVVSAFGHLGGTKDPELAKTKVDELYQLIRAEYTATKLVPFGWDKTLDLENESLSINVPLHHFNFGFASFSSAQAMWDEIASDYDELLLESGHYTAQHLLLHGLNGQIQAPALDLCCGTGRTRHYLESVDRHLGYVGVDISGNMIKLANKMASAKSLVPESNDSEPIFIQSDIEDALKMLKARREVFQTILLINATAYINLPKVLFQLSSIMGMDSRLIIADEDPFVHSTGPKAERIERVFSANKHHTINRYTVDDIKAEAMKCYPLIGNHRQEIDGKHDLVGMVFSPPIQGPMYFRPQGSDRDGIEAATSPPSKEPGSAGLPNSSKDTPAPSDSIAVDEIDVIKPGSCNASNSNIVTVRSLSADMPPPCAKNGCGLSKLTADFKQHNK
jgi:SAM-dependent methyltransferase